jgi:hypothetical protein
MFEFTFAFLAWKIILKALCLVFDVLHSSFNKSFFKRRMQMNDFFSETDMLADTLCHHLLKQNASHILLKDLIRNMFDYKHIPFFGDSY